MAQYALCKYVYIGMLALCCLSSKPGTVDACRDGATAVLSLDGRSSNVTSEFVSLDSSSNFWIGRSLLNTRNNTHCGQAVQHQLIWGHYLVCLCKCLHNY